MAQGNSTGTVKEYRGHYAMAQGNSTGTVKEYRGHYAMAQGTVLYTYRGIQRIVV